MFSFPWYLLSFVNILSILVKTCYFRLVFIALIWITSIPAGDQWKKTKKHIPGRFYCMWIRALFFPRVDISLEVLLKPNVPLTNARLRQYNCVIGILFLPSPYNLISRSITMMIFSFTHNIIFILINKSYISFHIWSSSNQVSKLSKKKNINKNNHNKIMIV